MKIQVMVSWVLTLCSDVVGYQCFRGPCCFHLQGEVNHTGKGGIGTGRREYLVIFTVYIYAPSPSTIHFTLKMEAARSS